MNRICCTHGRAHSSLLLSCRPAIDSRILHRERAIHLIHIGAIMYSDLKYGWSLWRLNIFFNILFVVSLTWLYMATDTITLFFDKKIILYQWDLDCQFQSSTTFQRNLILQYEYIFVENLHRNLKFYLWFYLLKGNSSATPHLNSQTVSPNLCSP